MKRLQPNLPIACLLLLASIIPGIAQAQEPHPLEVEADSLVAAFERMRSEYQELEVRLKSLGGEDSLVTARDARNLLLDGLDEIHELGDMVLKLEKKDLDSSELRGYVAELLDKIPAAIQVTAENLRAQLVDTEARVEAASPEELGGIVREIADLEASFDELYGPAVDHIKILEDLGLADAALRKDLESALGERAQLTAGRLRLDLEERNKFKKQSEKYPDNSTYQQHVDAAQTAIDSHVASLERTIKAMDSLGLDVTEYRTLIVSATGEIARGLSDAKVAVSLVQQWFGQAREWLVGSGPRVLIKIFVVLAILLVFRVLSKLVRKGVMRSIHSSRLRPSKLMLDMISRFTGSVVMAVGLLIALSQLGVSLGPMLAGLGVIGLVIGFALQETLANFASGMMILFYRPYDVGDYVEAAGVTGTVNHMSLVSTTILTIDNQTLIVPNGKIWGDVIRNVTSQRMRRVDMVFGISYGDDIPHAEAVLAAIIADHDKVLDDPAPVIKLAELGDSSVNFNVRPWVKTADYWDVKWDITREVKMRFDREGIGIPFPQRDVHIYEERQLAAGGEASAEKAE